MIQKVNINTKILVKRIRKLSDIEAYVYLKEIITKLILEWYEKGYNQRKEDIEKIEMIQANRRNEEFKEILSQWD